MSSGAERSKQAQAAPVAATVDALPPGTVVKGTYRILDFVGEGGAGAVYVAEHVSLGHQVAVKTLFGKFVRDDDMRRRFIEEAIIQANLSHPNIVKVIDVLDEPPLSAIFMEFVDGSSLDKRVARLNDPEPIETTAALFLPILDAMSYAHAQGVVHRDIKPANIMLASSSDGPIPKVTDFGIAKVLSDHRRTETGTAMGTVYYAPPEQLTDAKSVDHRADVYSLGCTLYELLTLQLPFEDPTMFGVMRKHVQAPRPDPSRLNPALPREVANIVMRAMAVKPDHRFQTCHEFGNELRRVLGMPQGNVSGVAKLPALPSAPAGSGPIALADRPELRTGGGPSAGLGSSAALGTGSGLGAPRTGVATANRTTPVRSGTARMSARATHPGTIHAPRRPARDRNQVALLIWIAIAVLAASLILAVLAGGRGGGDPVVSPTGDDGPSAVVPVVPPPEGSAQAAAETDPPPAEDTTPTPAAPDPARITECTELATRYLDFDPLGDVSFGEAIADLDDNAVPCAELLEANASGAFETASAFLTGVQIRTVLHELRARRAAGLGSPDCEDALVAVTEAHRGLRRISSAGISGELLDYEVMSLNGFRDDLTHVYVGLLRTFPQCPFVPIPDPLLGPEAFVEPERGDKPEPAEGSGEPTLVLTP